jgi:hypothetical protein
VFSPGPLLDPDNYGAPALAWLAALLTAAPATAYLMNRRQPVVTTEGVGLWTGIPQLPLMLLLVRLDVWKDVRSGYYVAWSGEKQTAYGIGTFVAVVVGLVLTSVVARASTAGARGRR